jgi:predicted component of type VI protein secretion system
MTHHLWAKVYEQLGTLDYEEQRAFAPAWLNAIAYTIGASPTEKAEKVAEATILKRVIDECASIRNVRKR